MVLVFGLPLPLLDLKRALYATMRQKKLKAIFLKLHISHSVITVTQIPYYRINPTKNSSLNSCNAHKQCRRVSEKKMLMCVGSNGNVWCNALIRQCPCFHCFHDFGRPKVQDTPGYFLENTGITQRTFLIMSAWQKKVDAKFSYHSSAFPFFRHKKHIEQS